MNEPPAPRKNFWLGIWNGAPITILLWIGVAFIYYFVTRYLL